jgi:uncharacterized protein (DUF488 family)
MRAFNVGYAGRSFEDFVEVLKRNGIEIIVDVRRFPRSKYPAFNKEFLENELPKTGIKYIHVVELGGFRDGYEEYTSSKEFQRGVEKLLDLVRRRISCIMCLERNPVHCHRRFIIRHLETEGVNITNL